MIELSATKGAVRYHSSSGLISTRYAVVTPKDMMPEYFFIVVEMGLPEFIHKYLTTINLQVEALNHYKITYHESIEDQEQVIKVARMADKLIKAEEKEIRRLKELKSFYQATMFPE